MSVKLYARELYRLFREVESLERKLKETPFENQGGVAEALRKARAEKERLRRILDGSIGR